MSDEGTFGQAIPGFADDLIMEGERKRILFFTENAGFRSNIGILNGTGAPMTISWARYVADGTMVEEASADLPPWGNVQLNRVFAGEAPVEAAFIDVWTETPGAAFIGVRLGAGQPELRPDHRPAAVTPPPPGAGIWGRGQSAFSPFSVCARHGAKRQDWRGHVGCDRGGKANREVAWG